jgi:hypothetical protein
MNTRLPSIVEKAPYVAAGSTGLAALTLNDWYMIVGITVSILTFTASFLLNWYYKWKDDKRKQYEHYLTVAGKLAGHKARGKQGE